jgi:hypothetical protein
MVFSLRAQLYLNPFKKKKNNDLETHSMVAGVVTILSGLAFDEKDLISFLNITCIIIVVIINVVFFVKLITVMLR